MQSSTAPGTRERGGAEETHSEPLQRTGGRRHHPLVSSEEKAHQHATEILRVFDQEIPEVGDRDVTLRDDAEGWLADIALERVLRQVDSQQGAAGDRLPWFQTWNQNEIGHSGAPEVADLLGGPSRTRTVDPLIKSDPRGIATEAHCELNPEDSTIQD